MFAGDRGLHPRIDVWVGHASRLYHGLRGARHNTLSDLGQYLDRAPTDLFPCPQQVPEPTSVKARSLRFRDLEILSLSWRSGHEVLSAHYRARHEEDRETNGVVRAQMIRSSKGPRRRALIYVHGWLQPGAWIEQRSLLPRWVRTLGLDVLSVVLPFHGDRRPRSSIISGEYFWTADVVRSTEAVRQAVHDLQAAMMWLRSSGYEEVGIVGISLGGAIAMLMACLEPTPNYVVPVICHLDLSHAVEHAPVLCRVRHDLERWGIGPETRRELFARSGIPTLLPRVDPQNQLWVMAKDDQFFSADLVEKQWDAWGRPRLEWLAAGHVTALLMTDRVTAYLLDFLADRQRVRSAEPAYLRAERSQ